MSLEAIKVYNILFYVSLAVTILGFGLAIFFFFHFRIREVYALMTGKAREDTVRKIAEKNEKTGSVGSHIYEVSDELGKSGRTGKSGRMGKTERTGRSGRINGSTERPAPQVEQHSLTREFNETSVLQSGAAETAVLQSDQTAILHRSEENQAQPYGAIPANMRFDLTENTLIIHADEVI